MRKTIALSTFALVLTAAVLGFVAGRTWQPLEESHVIALVAERFAQETGQPATLCAARPGQGQIWLVVACGQTVYHVDHKGRVVDRPLGGT